MRAEAAPLTPLMQFNYPVFAVFTALIVKMPPATPPAKSIISIAVRVGSCQARWRNALLHSCWADEPNELHLFSGIISQVFAGLTLGCWCIKRKKAEGWGGQVQRTAACLIIGSATAASFHLILPLSPPVVPTTLFLSCQPKLTNNFINFSLQLTQPALECTPLHWVVEGWTARAVESACIHCFFSLCLYIFHQS